MEVTVMQPRLIKLRSGAEMAPLQVSKRDAARLLDLSVRTIERLVERGELAQIGTGRLSRFAIDDLRAWQQRNRNQGTDHEAKS